MDNIAFEDRVLSRPGGSLFLIGDSGVGRRSTITLLAHLQRMQFFSPAISRKYDLKHFRQDIKELLRVSGVEGKPIVFYIEDHHLIEPAFLEDINSLLSAGEIPGLYANNQELETILSPLKETFANSGFACRNIYDFFVSRVRSNLHIVLSMDPTHPQFIPRTDSNPALFSRTTTVWMGKWSRAGMAEIPKMRLAKILQSQTSDGRAVDGNKILNSLLAIHESCLPRGATPLKYIAFLDTYLRIFESKGSGLLLQKKHLAAGLQKLTEAAQAVDVLGKDAAQKKDLVTKKQAEADSALEQITQRMQQASERKVEVEQLQKTLGGEEAKLNVRKAEIQNELKEIQPVLTAAREAVGGITKDSLNEIRALRAPPSRIVSLLSGVLQLMRQEDHSWNNMKKFLGSPSVKEDILNFDVNQIDSGNRAKVQALIQKDPEAFDKDKMMKVNVAAAPMAAWVQACVRYSEVLQTITPLRNQFEQASKQLEGARSRLRQCENDLKSLDAEVQTLKERFAKTTAEAETLKVALAKTTETLNAAQLLLSKLGGERSRWEAQVKGLSAGLDALTFNSMLAAGVVAYLGACPEDVRAQMMNEWKNKIGSADVAAFELGSFLSSESEFLKWKSEGLPSDELSLQNALMIENSCQTPFIIDPNGLATQWLKTHLSNNLSAAKELAKSEDANAPAAASSQLEVVMQQEARFVTTLELSIRFGKTLIISEVDGVSPLLYPLLRKDLYGQGPRRTVVVGEKNVDYNENFRLYLVTRDPAPDIPSNAKALINEINFTVTRSGLEGQLLGITLNSEKPELEQKKSELLAGEDKLKIQLAELEKSLLNELAQSEGNILENKQLIESLNQTKTQSNEIAQSLATSKDIQKNLDSQREVFRPIAHVGSILFFLISQLSSVNHMYEFSLPTFIRLFKQNLKAGKTNNGDEVARVASLCESLKYLVFSFITRSLFKADRLMFALHLAHCLKPKNFGPNEWEFFTGQLIGADEHGHHQAQSTGGNLHGAEGWLPPDRRADFVSFCSTFPQLVSVLRFSEEAWKNWIREPNAENDKYFPNFSGGRSLTPFQQLLVIKTLRPDRLQSAMHKFALEINSINSISPAPLNLQKLVDEVDPLEPILFVCEGGADPSQELEDFAQKTVGKNNFYQVALGSGQTDGAMELLFKCAREGAWLCLKNLHLVTHWLVALEKTLKTIQPNPKFRLWLTTESHPSFPLILLQQSLKISYESPPGIKQNLLRTYETWDEGFLSKGSVGRAQLLFILAWFHAIVQERRTYIPQGWTKFYEFSFADLRSGADIIDNLVAAQDAKRGGARGSIKELDAQNFPWTTVTGLLQSAIYGGRIDVDADVRVLLTYLLRFFRLSTLTSNQPDHRLTAGVDLPVTNARDDYLAIIRKLPDVDIPRLFSLPENIEGAVQQTQSAGVLSQLRKLAVSSESIEKFDRDVWRTQLSALLSYWEKQVKRDNGLLLQRPSKLSSKREEDYTPLEAFVVLESIKISDVLHTVHTTLSSLQSVLFASGLLSPDVKFDGQTLLSGIVPWRWAKNWYGPSEPMLWLAQVVQRKFYLNELQAKCESNALFNAPIKMGQLFTPKVYLNALRQQTARVTNTAIDSLKLVAYFERDLCRAPLKMEIEGLMIQGCSFNGKELAFSSASSSSVQPIPHCTLAFIGPNDNEPYGQRGLSVPVYVATTREEYVCDVKVPCGERDKDSWILGGVALLLNDFK